MDHIFQEFSGRVKGLKVEAVETTGAGDAFVAATLAQLASDLSLLQVISLSRVTQNCQLCNLDRLQRQIPSSVVGQW